MNLSSFGSQVREESPARIMWWMVLAALVSAGACDVYTPDLLSSSAGGSHNPSGGSSDRLSNSSFGGGLPLTTAGSNTDASTSDLPAQGGAGIGGSSSQTTGKSPTGGTGGLSSEPLGTQGGSGQTSTSELSTIAGSAGWSNPNGGAAGTTNPAIGGNSAQKCYLDDMLGPIASGPLKGCDASRESYWTSFLPPAESIVVKPPKIVPDPGVLFERQTIVPDDAVVLGSIKFVSTVSGRVIVTDQRKYSGIRFPLYVGAPYTLRGVSLHFYYRTRFTSAASALRVNVTTTATTSSQKPGGTCPQNCDDHYGIILPNTSGNWSLRSIRLETSENQGDLTRDWYQDDQVTFNIAQVLAIEFGFSAMESFEFSIGPIWLQWPSVN